MTQLRVGETWSYITQQELTNAEFVEIQQALKRNRRLEALGRLNVDYIQPLKQAEMPYQIQEEKILLPHLEGFKFGCLVECPDEYMLYKVGLILHVNKDIMYGWADTLGFKKEKVQTYLIWG